ncbi:MAG: hypothetical protein AAB409_08920, partial [Gemmatimonadota bacterium]
DDRGGTRVPFAERRRLAVTSAAELGAAIKAYIDRRNAAPTPFVWTARANHILAKVRKAGQALAT